MKRLINRAFSFAMIFVLLVSVFPLAGAEGAVKLANGIGSNEFIIANTSGASITEVYIYPSYTNSLGKARNNGWIYNNSEGKVAVTSREAQWDCLWNIRMSIKINRTYYWITFEDQDLSDFLGYRVSFTVDGNGYYSFEYPNEYTNDMPDGSVLTFTLYNDSGRDITEVYIYSDGASRWGKARNSKWIYDGKSTRISLTRTEVTTSRDYKIRIGFDYGWYVSYAEFNMDTRDYLGGTMRVSRTSSGGYQIAPMSYGF